MIASVWTTRAQKIYLCCVILTAMLAVMIYGQCPVVPSTVDVT